MTNIQTTVQMDDFDAKRQDYSCLASDVYTDDGRGNGNLIFTFPMN